ncbi:hypothetical protein T310_9015, partial [Rasamsonia emersonii CBS 393.64]
SNSSRLMSHTLGTRLPYPAFETRMSGRCPCCASISVNIFSICSAEETSTWWIEMRRSGCAGFSSSLTSAVMEARLLEYVNARWTPCWASCRAQAEPILNEFPIHI